MQAEASSVPGDPDVSRHWGEGFRVRPLPPPEVRGQGHGWCCMGHESGGAVVVLMVVEGLLGGVGGLWGGGRCRRGEGYRFGKSVRVDQSQEGK